MSVKFKLDVEITCAECGKKIVNHYPIEATDDFDSIGLENEFEKLLELNDWTWKDTDKEGVKDLCPDCQ